MVSLFPFQLGCGWSHVNNRKVFFVKSDSLSDDKPWWSYGHVWLVISGPVCVMIACVITFYFIINSPNQIISGQDVEIEHVKGAKTIDGGDAPAELARNHAATGEVPVPKSSLTTTK
jgi:hypothetical protein